MNSGTLEGFRALPERTWSMWAILVTPERRRELPS